MFTDVETIAKRARVASHAVQRLTASDRTAALQSMHKSLAAARDDLHAANTRDMTAARAAQSAGDLSSSLVRRLDLFGADGRKFDATLAGVASVAGLPDPVGVASLARQLDDGLDLFRVSCPIGVIAVVFEARPEAAVQIASLAVKSGNSVILKGGKEGEHSNAALVATIRRALVAAEFPQDAVQLVETREEVHELLVQDAYVDLVIPRGSNELVRYITEHTRIPVMGHADGICAVYVDKEADGGMAADVAVDSKAQYPAVCNAAETLLVARDALSLLPGIGARMAEAGVQLRTDEEAMKVLLEAEVDGLDVIKAREEDYDTEFLELKMAVKVVNGVEEAVEHINQHGSGHTDCIVTENVKTAKVFQQMVDSAGVFHNASTRFADGFRYGFGAEVGVSTHRTHARGPVGLEGLLIYKYKLFGSGHVVAPYSDGRKEFSHKDIQTSGLDGR